MSESIKARLLKGVGRTDTVLLPVADVEVTVRPLTDAESSEAEQAAVSGQVYHGKRGDRAPQDMQIAIDVSAKGQAEARRIKAAYGLSVGGEKWTPKEVGKLAGADVRAIAAKVDELTGDGEEDQAAAEQFRGDGAGPDDGDPAPDGDTAGGDAG